MCPPAWRGLRVPSLPPLVCQRPDITAYGRYSYQNGVPFFDKNFGTFGIHLIYDLFDAGKRSALVRERRA
jgi:hypothetical protein